MFLYIALDMSVPTFRMGTATSQVLRFQIASYYQIDQEAFLLNVQQLFPSAPPPPLVCPQAK